MFTRHLEFSSSHAHRELMSLSLSGVLGFRDVESDQNPRNLR